LREIASVNNQKIKDVTALHQRKNRTKEGLFLIEGEKGVVEALYYGIKFESIFVAADCGLDTSLFPDEILYTVNDAVMKKISTTDSPPNIMAVAYQKQYRLKDLFNQENPLVLVLENIKDAGNLGTIIRTACACGVSGIALTDNTVDIYNPKTVRASVGNLWKIPIVYIQGKSELKSRLNGIKKCQFLATVVKDDASQKLFFDVDYTAPTVIMFGSEAEGLSEELARQADVYVTIPMSGGVESLNLSVSVGVILYEALRQKSFR